MAQPPSMTDLMDLEGWKQLELDLHQATNMNAAAYDDQGAMFTGQKTWGNQLCPKIKSVPAGLSAICAVANKAMTAQARAEHRSVIDQCDAGLTKICVPVFLNGDYIGAVGGCGVLLPGEETDTFLVHKTLDADQAEITALAQDIPAMTQETAQQVAADLEQRVAEIVAAYLKRMG